MTNNEQRYDWVDEDGVLRRHCWLTVPVREWGREAPRECLSRLGIARIKRLIAWKLVKTALRTGYLIRSSCEICGHPKTQAHHDDYDFPLIVRWLCTPDHSQADRERRAKEN
jgi:hypothetical protein